MAWGAGRWEGRVLLPSPAAGSGAGVDEVGARWVMVRSVGPGGVAVAVGAFGWGARRGCARVRAVHDNAEVC